MTKPQAILKKLDEAIQAGADADELVEVWVSFLGESRKHPELFKKTGWLFALASLIEYLKNRHVQSVIKECLNELEATGEEAGNTSTSKE